MIRSATVLMRLRRRSRASVMSAPSRSMQPLARGIKEQRPREFDADDIAGLAVFMRIGQQHHLLPHHIEVEMTLIAEMLDPRDLAAQHAIDGLARSEEHTSE